MCVGGRFDSVILGAHINACGTDHATPLMAARKHRRMHVIKILEDAELAQTQEHVGEWIRLANQQR